VSSSGLPPELVLLVGEQFRAPITGAASQGYGWSVVIDGDRDAITVETAGIPPETDVGVGSWEQELRITALEPGVARLQLTLARGSGRIREQHNTTVRVSTPPS
jgi:hypothetical protein